VDIERFLGVRMATGEALPGVTVSQNEHCSICYLNVVQLFWLCGNAQYFRKDIASAKALRYRRAKRAYPNESSAG
jgi:hypothetical protein